MSIQMASIGAGLMDRETSTLVVAKLLEASGKAPPASDVPKATPEMLAFVGISVIREPVKEPMNA